MPVSISAAGNVDLFSPTAFISNLGSYTKSDTWPVTSSMQSDTGHILCLRRKVGHTVDLSSFLRPARFFPLVAVSSLPTSVQSGMPPLRVGATRQPVN